MIGRVCRQQAKGAPMRGSPPVGLAWGDSEDGVWQRGEQPWCTPSAFPLQRAPPTPPTSPPRCRSSVARNGAAEGRPSLLWACVGGCACFWPLTGPLCVAPRWDRGGRAPPLAAWSLPRRVVPRGGESLPPLACERACGGATRTVGWDPRQPPLSPERKGRKERWGRRPTCGPRASGLLGDPFLPLAT